MATCPHAWYGTGMSDLHDMTRNPVLLPWQGKAIMLVDLDAFFASVEQLDHPSWRGKPVIVGGDPDRRGVVSTASYEARVYGVHSAMASATARRLCPDAIWTRGNFARYHEMSDKVMAILLDESPLLQQVSIDEAFLDVTPGRHTGEHPVRIAERIRMRVAELGITCSIGLGTSKTVAKIASDRDKPNGITVVFPGSERAFLAPLPVRDLSGIGRKSAEKLHVLGITTLGEIAESEEAVLRPIFGTNTTSLIARCRGEDTSEVETERDIKSVSNEMTFSTDLMERTEIEEAVTMLAAKVGRRLRKKGLAGHTATLKMRYDDLSRRTAQKRLATATSDENVFGPICLALIDELWSPGVHIRLIGVGVSGFGEETYQPDLFSSMDFDEGDGSNGHPSGAEPHGTRTDDAHRHSQDERRQQRRNLIEATDRVKDRFGDDAVGFGRELRFRNRGTGTAPQHKDR